jgi:hypothetical protein
MPHSFLVSQLINYQRAEYSVRTTQSWSYLYPGNGDVQTDEWDEVGKILERGNDAFHFNTHRRRTSRNASEPFRDRSLDLEHKLAPGAALIYYEVVLLQEVRIVKERVKLCTRKSNAPNQEREEATCIC